MTDLEELPLTDEQERERVAFLNGARYMFARLGMWSGRNIKIYDNYFKDCAIRGEKPRLVSMIHEEICDLAEDYARGWRDKPYEKVEPYVPTDISE